MQGKDADSRFRGIEDTLILIGAGHLALYTAGTLACIDQQGLLHLLLLPVPFQSPSEATALFTRDASGSCLKRFVLFWSGFIYRSEVDAYNDKKARMLLSVDVEFLFFNPFDGISVGLLFVQKNNGK
jgi:hypothetical protein